MTARSEAARNALALLAIAALVVGVYWPGLSGAYIFDDFSFVVDNSAVHVVDGTLSEWARAALAFPGSHQGRWLTMLTFGANHALTGLDPFWFKLTNVGIHLLNGLLLFFVVRALVDWRRAVDPAAAERCDRDVAALAIAACWMLLPINLTGVLYVSQRLESLSHTFVFLGLALYLRARVRTMRDGSSLLPAFVRLVACTLVGLLAKESAVLLPAYAFAAELALGGFRDARVGRALRRIYGAMIVVPLLIGLAWLATWVGTGDAPARPFTTGQRLLTETRVLVDYIAWTLVPTANALGLYHDDMTLSRGLLDPPSTLLAIGALAGLLALAAWQWRRRPLLTLGILWFFAAHALTATVIPLELVYEHRNYFASVGLLLALASLFYFDRPATLRPTIVAILVCVALTFYAGLTALRAREWGSPIALALSEAGKHPLSPNAQYELGRTLTLASNGTADDPLAERAQQAFRAGARAPGNNALPDQGLIVLAARRGQPIDPAWWAALTRKLAAQSPSEGNISALANLVTCQANGSCPPQVAELGAAFRAAMSHKAPSARLVSAYADYADDVVHDAPAAEQLMRRAIALKPNEPAYRSDLIEFLAVNGRKADAERELDGLVPLNHFGSLDEMIATLRSLIAAPHAPPPPRRDAPPILAAEPSAATTAGAPP